MTGIAHAQLIVAGATLSKRMSPTVFAAPRLGSLMDAYIAWLQT